MTVRVSDHLYGQRLWRGLMQLAGFGARHARGEPLPVVRATIDGVGPI